MAQKRVLRTLITALVISLMVLVGTRVWDSLHPYPKQSSRPYPNKNTLAIGPESVTEGTIEIELTRPLPLNFMTKAQVLDMRRQALMGYPMLIKGSYTPAESVFGQIEDGRPWWGIVGLWYYNFQPGERSILGPSDQSRFLLNPYLLVAADVRTETVNGGDWEWNTEKVTEAAALNGTLPMTPEPSDLRWMPSSRRAEVTYHVTRYVATVNPYMVNELRQYRAWADLTAYNARDLNLNYIFVSYRDSINVGKDHPPAEAYENPQFLHKGGSCGYPGGCNNRSPATPILDDLKLAIPATVTIFLWKDKPLRADSTPDFTFLMHFD